MLYSNTFMKFRINQSNLWILFLVFLFLGNTPLFSQKKSLSEIESELKETPRGSERVEKLIEYSRALHRENHNEEKEYKFAYQATELALELNDTLLYAKALDNFGLLYRYHQRYSQSIPFHVRAFKLVEDKENVEPIQKMIYGNNIGVAARYNQQYDLSVEYYLKALKIAKKEDNIKNIAISSNGLGNALMNIPGREKEALSYFQKALRAERQKNDSLGIAMDLLSIGDYYTVQKEYGKALNYLDTLFSINAARKDTFGLAITNQAYGMAYLKEGKDLKKAKDYYLKSLKQYQGLKNLDKEAELLRELGSLHLELKEQNVALDYFKKSLSLAENNNYKGLIFQNAYSIAAIKEAQKKFPEALFYYQKGKVYEDSLAMSNQEIKVAALTSQYQLDQKEEKISNLVEENLQKDEMVQSQEEKIRTHKMFTIALIGFALLVLLSLLLHYKTSKLKNKAVQSLHEKQEELLKEKYEKSLVQAEMLASRSQLNPHFLFNCFTGIHLLIQKGEYKKADQYLILLSRFVRMILELPKSHSISLNEELKLIKYYVSLEEKRFNGEFQFNLETLSEEEMEDIEIPPLLLQPFVENAIWHGLLPSEKQIKKLDIQITRSDSDIRIVIEDNGVGRGVQSKVHIDEIKEGKKSMGMKITKDRIIQFNKSSKSKIKFQVIDKMDENSGQSTGTKVVLVLSNCLNDK